MKKTLFALFMTLAVAVSTWADVQIQVLDFTLRKVRFVYTIEDNLEGNKVFLFPGSGFLHDTTRGQVIVESVFDRTSNREMEYSLQETTDTRLPQLRITYPQPLRAGEKKLMQVSVVVYLPSQNIGRDTQNRYYFEYETSHQFEFVVPRGQYVTFVNQPVLIYEREGLVYLKQAETKDNPKISIQMRSM